MLKLVTSYKETIPSDQKFGSKSVLISLETELPTGLKANELQNKIHGAFARTQDAVQQEIALLTGRKPTPQQHRSERPAGTGGDRATNRQIQFILKLGQERGMGLPELNKQVSDLYGAGNLYNLTKKDASQFVDTLKQAA